MAAAGVIRSICKKQAWGRKAPRLLPLSLSDSDCLGSSPFRREHLNECSSLLATPRPARSGAGSRVAAAWGSPCGATPYSMLRLAPRLVPADCFVPHPLRWPGTDANMAHLRFGRVHEKRKDEYNSHVRDEMAHKNELGREQALRKNEHTRSIHSGSLFTVCYTGAMSSQIANKRD